MQNQETGLSHSPVIPARPRAELLLDALRQADALLHILILYEFEHDIAFCRIGIEACIALLVIAFD